MGDRSRARAWRVRLGLQGALQRPAVRGKEDGRRRGLAHDGQKVVDVLTTRVQLFFTRSSTRTSCVSWASSSANRRIVAMVMELADLGSLRQMLDDDGERISGASRAWQLSIAHDICAGMAHLHAKKPKPIMHNDLKSATILLCSSGGVVTAPGGQDLGLWHRVRA